MNYKKAQYFCDESLHKSCYQVTRICRLHSKTKATCLSRVPMAQFWMNDLVGAKGVARSIFPNFDPQRLPLLTAFCSHRVADTNLMPFELLYQVLHFFLERSVYCFRYLNGNSLALLLENVRKYLVQQIQIKRLLMQYVIKRSFYILFIDIYLPTLYTFLRQSEPIKVNQETPGQQTMIIHVISFVDFFHKEPGQVSSEVVCRVEVTLLWNGQNMGTKCYGCCFCYDICYVVYKITRQINCRWDSLTTLILSFWGQFVLNCEVLLSDKYVFQKLESFQLSVT